jgi:hypothetical protein
MKTYPTSARILIAEDVREEIGGKHTIVGVFSGDDIRFQRPKDLAKEARPTLGQLGTYALFTGGEGEYATKVELISPSGKIVNSAGPFSSHKTDAVNMIVSCTWAPIRFPENGRYKIRILVDDKEFTQEFSVIEIPSEDEQKAAATAA